MEGAMTPVKTEPQDLELLTPTQMRELGWVDVHWRKEHGPGRHSNYYGMPKGRLARTTSAPARSKGPAKPSSEPVNRVVVTAQAWRGILAILDEWWDGRECGGCLLVSRDGATVTVHEMTSPYLGHYRTETEMKVYDAGGFQREADRQALGVPWIYGGLLHSHGAGSQPIPSEADKLGFSVRTRASLGDLYIGLISVPEDNGYGVSFRNIRAYACQLIDGRHPDGARGPHHRGRLMAR